MFFDIQTLFFSSYGFADQKRWSVNVSVGAISKFCVSLMEKKGG